MRIQPPLQQPVWAQQPRATHGRYDDPVAPPVWEVATLLGLTTLFATFFAFGGYPVVNVGGPVALCLVLGGGALQLGRRVPEAIWSPLFSLRVASIVYFGIGAFASNFFDPRSEEHILSLYGYSDEEAAKANLVWFASIALMLLGARFFRRRELRRATVEPVAGDESTGRMGFIFFALGFAFNVFVWMPSSLGWISVTIPGAVMFVMEAVNSGGIFLLSYWAFGKGPKGYLLVAFLLLLSAVLAFIVMTKQAIILPMLLISLAWLMRGVTLSRIAVITGLLIATFWVAVPIVSLGRERIQMGQETIGERLGTVGVWVEGGAADTPEEAINPLVRLAFLNTATYVIGQYDMNEPADTIEMAFVAVIPRAIWPDKPILTEINSQLFYELTGGTGTHITTTVPAEVYWNFGWAGVIFLSPLLGLPLMIGSGLSVDIVRRRNWFMMPFVLLAFRIPLAVDSQFVSAIFAPAVMASFAYLGLRFAEVLLPGLRAPDQPRLVRVA